MSYDYVSQGCGSNCVSRLSDKVWGKVTVDNICKTPDKKFATIQEMVAFYNENLRECTEKWLKSLSAGQDKTLWITNFICGEANISRDPAEGRFCKNLHQRRRTAATIKEARVNLEAYDFSLCSTFTEILDKTIELTKSVKWFGALCCYDFALRYGFHRNIFPDAVYLHAGTSIGLDILLRLFPEIEVIKDKKYGRVIKNLSSLPKEIAELGSMHIENFLCIFDDHLLRYLNHMLGMNGKPGPYYGIYNIPKEEKKSTREPKWKSIRRELEEIYRDAKQYERSFIKK